MVRDTIVFVNHLHKDLILFGKKNFETIYAFLGVLHFSYVRQIGNVMVSHKTGLEEALTQLVHKVYSIYDRDLKETINQASTEDLLSLILCSSNIEKLEPLLQSSKICSAFFWKINSAMTFRDVLIKKYLYWNIERQGNMSLENNWLFAYQLLLPYIILGESIKHDINDEDVTYLHKVVSNEQLFLKELASSFPKAVSIGGQEDPLGALAKSLRGIRNTLSHEHHQAENIKALMLKYWFKDDKYLFLQTTGDLLSYNVKSNSPRTKK
ncbi:hypothetical protein FDP41_004960 [Naegleria fowleri]|uniref:Uncharacterized protein n=1 Tax=Naegleria fowleri TaxID=5763 RepID=A0A6A5BS87_NAEFO|nr:uncharacterized protein FDP41_004960 [Naegleria fowleri]KAF0976285.1 hypothetical protein FDP41_004960 [Naegleria fowleri]